MPASSDALLQNSAELAEVGGVKKHTDTLLYSGEVEPSNPDTKGAEGSVLVSEVSLFQRLKGGKG